MILTNRSPAGIVEADVCIVGGGPVGISIALELIKTDINVILLVGGGAKRESLNDQDLNRGIIARAGTHERLEENRRRQFGGASVAWGGRCVPFDRIDFQKRTWMKHSGWPFTFDDLVPYYQRALALCRGGPFVFDGRIAFPSNSSEIIPGIDNADLESWHLERWSPPVNFGREYRGQLESAKNLRVFMNAHLLSLESEDRKDEVSVGRAIRAGRRIDIRAGMYVLAAGGIENPRILLASRGRFHANGVGNDRDMVGRFYMCHLHGTFALIYPTSRSELLLRYERDAEGVYCRRRWWIPSETQRRTGIGNIIFFLDYPSFSNNRDGLFSAVFIAKALLSIRRSPDRARFIRELAPTLREHMEIVVAQGPDLLPTLWNVARARFASRRRLPSVLPPKEAACFGLYFQAEQAPNPNSRIMLSPDQVDAHGIPRAVVDLVFDELDVKTVVRAHRIFMERFKAGGAGEITCDENELVEYIRNQIQHFNSAAHHLGTTRIACSPEEGVVDENCKVHGVENVYIAGSSVFPTGGHANPTLTSLALAIRLGDFLRNKFETRRHPRGANRVGNA